MVIGAGGGKVEWVDSLPRHVAPSRPRATSKHLWQILTSSSNRTLIAVDQWDANTYGENLST